MKLLKLTLLVGFVLLFLGAFLIVEFPNAGWNHAVSEIVWVLSIGLVIATLGFCVLVVVRLFSRLARRLPSQTASPEPLGPTPEHPQINWSRTFGIGSIVLLAAAVFVVVLLVLVEHQLKSSPVYLVSVQQAQGSAIVIAALGQPVVAGWFVSGQITESTDGSGQATLTIPLKGPKGDGRLRVEAGRQAGNWRLSSLQFVSGGHASTTDLLADHVN